MRVVIVPMCILAISCGQSSDNATRQAEQAESYTPQTLAADGQATQGRYRAVDENGVVLIEELRADGTYTFSSEDGEVLETGTYEQKSAEELCFLSDAEAALEICYQDQITDEGLWLSTDPNTGLVATITRMEN